MFAPRGSHLSADARGAKQVGCALPSAEPSAQMRVDDFISHVSWGAAEGCAFKLAPRDRSNAGH